jgi:hypothetical protein
MSWISPAKPGAAESGLSTLFQVNSKLVRARAERMESVESQVCVSRAPLLDEKITATFTVSLLPKYLAVFLGIQTLRYRESLVFGFPQFVFSASRNCSDIETVYSGRVPEGDKSSTGISTGRCLPCS